jgi:membrane protein
VIAAKYSSAYGVLGSFIAMMVWVYYASTVLFLGAEFVKVLGEKRKPAVPETPRMPGGELGRS